MLESGIARLVEVPADGGAVDRQLAELDVKLTAWIEAASKFQMDVAARAETPGRSDRHDDRIPEEQGEPHGTSPSSGGARPTESSACEGHHAKATKDDRAIEEAGAPNESNDVSQLRALFESRPAHVPHETGQGDGEVVESESETEAQQEPQPCLSADEDVSEVAGTDSEWSAVEDEENALLASLDPKTRRDIHVLRRISAERKSIHQLLEEYRAAQGRQSEAQASEPDKRSWWRLSR